MERRTTRLGSNKMRLSDAPSRRLKTRVRSSGDLAEPEGPLSTAISRRSPVPVQPAHNGRPLMSGPDGNPGPPECVLARHVPRRRISLWGYPLRPALALPHFRIASRSAPSWTGREQDKAGLKCVDRYTFTFS